MNSSNNQQANENGFNPIGWGQEAMEKAKNILQAGGVVGLPTETVYGLAARIDFPHAIEKIFKVKERPFFDPLIVHVSSIEMAKKATAEWASAYQVLAEAFWPGPLTLILPRATTINSMITSGLDSVGVRMPSHPLALQLISEVGVPLAAPSANKFGRTSPTTAAHVQAEFINENVFVLDGGHCQIGIESTVLWIRMNHSKVNLSILRKGHILKSDIESVLFEKGFDFEFTDQVDKRESPGHMKHHYMPSVPLIVCNQENRSVESILIEVNQKLGLLPDEIESIKIIKPKNGIHTGQVLVLSEDPVIAAREFYGNLRDSAAFGKDSIIFYRRAHQVGERWESLFDRLNKAASLII